MNVIIVAAIALIVLVVIALIFTGRMKIFGKTLASCESKGANASCIAKTDPGQEPGCDGIIHKTGTDCEQKESTPWCCVPI